MLPDRVECKRCILHNKQLQGLPVEVQNKIYLGSLCSCIWFERGDGTINNINWCTNHFHRKNVELQEDMKELVKAMAELHKNIKDSIIASLSNSLKDGFTNLFKGE